MEKIYPLLHQLTEFLPQFIFGILALIPFFIIWVFVKVLFSRLQKKVEAKKHVISFFAKTINILILIVAIITMLGTWGVDISALIAGLGLTGFALGFALKDVLASTIAGILILFYQPFKLYSRIIVMGVEGEVVGIDMRYTTLQNGTEVHLIPNSKLISEKVTIVKETIE